LLRPLVCDIRPRDLFFSPHTPRRHEALLGNLFFQLLHRFVIDGRGGAPVYCSSPIGQFLCQECQSCFLEPRPACPTYGGHGPLCRGIQNVRVRRPRNRLTGCGAMRKSPVCVQCSMAGASPELLRLPNAPARTSKHVTGTRTCGPLGRGLADNDRSHGFSIQSVSERSLGGSRRTGSLSEFEGGSCSAGTRQRGSCVSAARC
jgi:hypothetical protein